MVNSKLQNILNALLRPLTFEPNPSPSPLPRSEKGKNQFLLVRV